MRNGLLGALVVAAGACALSAVPAQAEPASRFQVRPVAKNGAGLSDAKGNMAFSRASYPKFFAAYPTVPSQQARQAAALLSEEQTAQSGALVAGAEGLDCAKADPLGGKDDPKLPLVACSSDAGTKYVLKPAIIDGAQVSCVVAGSGADLVFSPQAQSAWSQYTSKNAGTLAAVVVDSKVVATIEVNGPTPFTVRLASQDASPLVQALGGCHA
ncbi:hypothetical protein [Segniliparus rugosus]|uniref:Secreted protein n=1 Tax=Segniliparus rugosus (strain ATCC BAA-974 / DSM 45345 / CCUG 50838 / CIP 108380 / JCM 13579 / CDC 945) TaxID=679197 RepID=E5XT87_SEGRC|nr:hypothetical protein [Segniliparus rugosus]EFV12418.1 hypothetical protein HMPREF9336_02709 [Segniliparus rugosus ATCC BAA-974]